MAKHALCYLIDDNYLFPTLVSASQAAAQVDRATTDIIIVVLGEPSAAIEVCAPICSALGVTLQRSPRAAIDDMHPTYARLFIDRLIAPIYERVVYIDADTQIAGDLRDLFMRPIPAGAFLAARDPLALAIDRPTKSAARDRAYFASIGLSPKRMRRYFNAGVLAFARDDWRAVASPALDLVRTRALRFKDQDALNLVEDGRALPLSLKWNFPIFLINAGLERVLAPHVYHFMSNPRPWHGAFQPWGARWHAPYLDMLAYYPQLGPLASKMALPVRLRYMLQQRAKAALERVTWRTRGVHSAVDAFERDAEI